MTSSSAPPTPDEVSTGHVRRWWVLTLVAVSQLMLALDASVVNIALPAVQEALGVTDAGRQWVVTAYALPFGGLLLLGGRIADFVGRKRVFVIGLGGFAAASILGGLAGSAGVLFAARGLQGVFAALMAPAALSILSLLFPHGKERATAFSVYGAMSGGGVAIGLIIGGVLTEYASWRWCLLINAPIAIAAAVGVIAMVTESRVARQAGYDLTGAVTGTLGLLALVYGVTKTQEGWTSAPALVPLVMSAMLLCAFVVVETRSPYPLLPLHIVTNRARAAAFINCLVVGAALFAVFLFLSYYMQGTLGYSPIKTGLGFLPFAIGIGVGAGVGGRLIQNLSPKIVLVSGLIIDAVGLLLFTQIGSNTSYITHLLPGQLISAVGTGIVFVTVTSAALTDVAEQDAGVASALVNTAQQIGGSLGIAVLNSIVIATSTGFLTNHPNDVDGALLQGLQVAFACAAVLPVAGALLAAMLLRNRPDRTLAKNPI